MQVKTPFTRKLLLVSLLCVAPLVGTPAYAAGSDGYLTDRDGNPVRSYSGECWHTRYWKEGSRFADCEPAPVVEAPAPKVVEAPVPVVEQTPPAPVPQNVPFRLSMDALFDFDKATLRLEGKTELDQLARQLAVTQYDKLTIVGHTDRIGPAVYNQKLSERRASAIREYLIAQGIDAQRIEASGVGESAPIASCPGLHGKRLIACLQPDRHAELTATGNEVRLSEASR
jgi:OOP family OmpA-OmpF porin